MTADAPIEAVVFDYGGVLTNPVRQSLEAWRVADGIDPTSLTRVLRSWLSRNAPDGSPIHRLETGHLSPVEFERVFAAELKAVDGRAVDPSGLLGRVFAHLAAEPPMFALVDELRAHGLRTGLLSNSWGNTYPRQRLDALFDVVVISGEVGMRKPLAPIYLHTSDKLGVRPERTLFIDDVDVNLHGARAVGMRTLLHTCPAATRASVVSLIPGMAPHQSRSTRPTLHRSEETQS